MLFLFLLPCLTAAQFDHPHPPCCPACPHGPCTACRTPGPVPPTCCPCLPPYPPEPACTAPDTCLKLSTRRGYGVGLGMVGDFGELMVFAGGFKGNDGLDRIDIYNQTSQSWLHARMSANRTLFGGAALGPIAVFGCGEGDGAGTADILDVRTLQVRTVHLAGGSRKKCAATSVVLASDPSGNPTDGKILIGGGYKSVAVDIWDLKSDSWSLTNMSISHFYMAAASAGPYSLFCGGLAPSGDTALCDIYDARGAGRWLTGNLSHPVREISAASLGGGGTGVPALAVFLGGGQTTVFNASNDPPTWTYGNSTPGRSPWCKFGRASVGGRWAVFAGGNGNTNAIEVFDGALDVWSFAEHNLSFGREQVMGAGTADSVGFAGGSIGAYKPTGYTDRVDVFRMADLLTYSHEETP